MNNLLFAGNKALYLVLIMAAGPIIVATLVGLLVGLCQTVLQLQEQTLPFGIKLLSVTPCLFCYPAGMAKRCCSLAMK
ncbi:hypothetical protein SODG_006740 [Sodalis praecaptivus]